jgi:hypothetical protein
VKTIACPQCQHDMMPEHAHARCPKCGFIEPCCDGEPAPLSSWHDSPLGKIWCEACGGEWACHYSAWMAGGQRCVRCGAEELMWAPT